MCLEKILAEKLDQDMGKLILRVSLGLLMLFHGLKKISTGVDGMKGMLTAAGFPEFLAYGAYMGEVVAPLLLILGLFTRVSALIYSFTMAFAIYLVHANDLFTLHAKTGGLMAELPLLYLLSALALFFMGSGKYSLDAKFIVCGCAQTSCHTSSKH